MKARKGLERYQYLIYALLIAPQAWYSLHGKIIVYEAVVYCAGLVASLFLALLTPSGWGAKNMEEAVGKEKRQEEASP